MVDGDGVSPGVILRHARQKGLCEVEAGDPEHHGGPAVDPLLQSPRGTRPTSARGQRSLEGRQQKGGPAGKFAFFLTFPGAGSPLTVTYIFPLLEWRYKGTRFCSGNSPGAHGCQGRTEQRGAGAPCPLSAGRPPFPAVATKPSLFWQDKFLDF